MLLKNVHVDNHEEVVDVRILNGKFSEIKANLTPHDGEEVIDGKENLLLPPFVDWSILMAFPTTSSIPKE